MSITRLEPDMIPEIDDDGFRRLESARLPRIEGYDHFKPHDSVMDEDGFDSVPRGAAEDNRDDSFAEDYPADYEDFETTAEEEAEEAVAATEKRTVKERVREKQQAAKQKVYDKTPDRFKNANALQVRFRTGFVYVAVSVICVLLGNAPTMAYLALVSGICAGEFYYMMRVDARLPNELIGIAGAALYPVAMWRFGMPGIGIVTFLLMLALLVWYVYYMRARIPDLGVSFFGAAYTGMLLSSLLLVRQSIESPWGGVLVLLLFCSVWFNDAGAYLVGSKFGKHKLAPKTSPKKSWEGFIAGLVVSAGFWCLMTLVPGVTMSIPQAIVFGLLCGGASVIGDLAESRIKRNVGVKDSGTIMPGHGGLLDRCDSMFLASVAAAILLFAGGCIPYAW